MGADVIFRAVERFPEPAFTELVDRVLHDPERRAIGERLFGPPSGTAPTASLAQQVRIGAFDGDTLVGWSHALLPQTGTMYVSNSGVVARYRRRGIYSGLVAAMEQQARALGCKRIESHHRAANSDVLIAKMKLGYVIVGTEFSAEMGLLVKLCKHLDVRRRELFDARSGIVEGAVRFFGGYSSDSGGTNG